MNTATIYFSDQSSITVKEGDLLIPVSLTHINGEVPFASMGVPVEIYNHIHDGLIPALVDVLCQCEFFYVNTNNNVIYSSKAVVKIETH